MFWAKNKNTSDRTLSTNPNYSEDFYKNENWFADSTLIENCPKGIDINKIEVIFRKGSDNLISSLGTIFDRLPHFYIKNAKELGIIVKPNLKEHTQCISFIYNLLKNKKLKILVSISKQNNFKEVDSNLFDIDKLDTEVHITSRNKKIADILLPLKKYDNYLGFGIIIEIQLTKQRESTELERSYDRSNKGYSICWLKPEDFEDIKNENLELINDYIEIKDYSTVLKQFKEKCIDDIKEITINYSLMLDSREEKIKEMLDKIKFPTFKDCPKCNGLLTIKKGSSGNFYGCSNYPSCRFTTNII